MPSLGRLIHPDLRDTRHILRAYNPTSFTPVSKFWRTMPSLNQGQEGSCVGHAWRHFLNAGPIMIQAGLTARDIYKAAQKMDEWPGEDYEGTSVRAGAKLLHGLQMIKEYLWAWSNQDILSHLLHRGPLVMGTWWYDSMWEPDKDGYLHVNVDAKAVGGHAYLLYGYSVRRDAFRFQNSWGPEWGDNGRWWMKRDEFAFLISGPGQAGEACSALEVRHEAVEEH